MNDEKKIVVSRLDEPGLDWTDFATLAEEEIEVIRGRFYLQVPAGSPVEPHPYKPGVFVVSGLPDDFEDLPYDCASALEVFFQEVDDLNVEDLR
jgi:hypothetical protein